MCRAVDCVRTVKFDLARLRAPPGKKPLREASLPGEQQPPLRPDGQVGLPAQGDGNGAELWSQAVTSETA